MASNVSHSSCKYKYISISKIMLYYSSFYNLYVISFMQKVHKEQHMNSSMKCTKNENTFFSFICLFPRSSVQDPSFVLLALETHLIARRRKKNPHWGF